MKAEFPKETLNPNGTVQGGQMNSMLDDITSLLLIYESKGKIYPNSTNLHSLHHRPLHMGPVIATAQILKKGKRIAFLNLGTRLKKVLEINEMIKNHHKLNCTVVDMRFAKPIDTKLIQNLNKTHDIFITIEENAIGGFSSQVNDFLINKLNKTPKILNFFMKDEFIDQSDIDDQYNKSGISKELIFDKISILLK